MQAMIERFFQNYVEAYNSCLGTIPDYVTIRDSYMPCFAAAGPTGVLCAQNDDEFIAFLERGFEFYRSIGTKRMLLVKVDLTPIDDHHQMARVFFSSQYLRPGGAGSDPKHDGGGIETVTIDFDVTYMLHIENGSPKIFAYVAGDERAAFREHGLITEP